MKTKIYFMIILALLLGISYYSCKEKVKEVATVQSSDMVYMCPMDCEKGKYYDKEGKCPKCGMKLKLVSKPNELEENYKMTFASDPNTITAGQPATLIFKPIIVGKENEAVALDVQHEKKIHLIVVSKDLSYFEHIHPEYQADGTYKISVLGKDAKFKNGMGHEETKFEHGGEYTLFADYLPSGGNHQVEKITINVSEKIKPEMKPNGNKWEGKSGDYKSTLVPDNKELKAGDPVHFSGMVLDKTGKEIDMNSIEYYLGAKAHMVVVSLDDKEYLHVHPEVNGGKFDLNTTFAKAGIYKGWIQFQIKGEVHTVDFVFDVKN
jgi:hypothetical protein